MMQRLLGLTLLCCSLLVSAYGANDPAWTLERLMTSLSAVGAIDATFREEKTLAILEQPLVTTGTLRYRPPGYLKKQTLEPYRKSYQIDEHWLLIETPDEGWQSFALDSDPAIRVFVESIRATLGGDLQRLQQYYRVQLQGQATDWTLHLEPLDARMAEYVTAIIIHGQEGRVHRVETLEAGGDRGVLSITSIHE